jgi:hypothetical protein
LLKEAMTPVHSHTCPVSDLRTRFPSRATRELQMGFEGAIPLMLEREKAQEVMEEIE